MGLFLHGQSQEPGPRATLKAAFNLARGQTPKLLCTCTIMIFFFIYQHVADSEFEVFDRFLREQSQELRPRAIFKEALHLRQQHDSSSILITQVDS